MKDELDSSWKEIVENQLRLSKAARDALPDLQVPYFAHMRLLREGRTRDVLLGARTLVGSGVTVIDWQHAPLAQVFFACREGEPYEVEVEDRSLVGTLTQRNLVAFERGELIEIVTPEAVLSRRNRDDWVELRGDRQLLLFPRSAADRARPFSPVLMQLDPDQRRAVELPPSRSVLVLGEAGYGKTTVALHRLAFLQQQALAAKRPFQAVVIVPTKGLRRLAVSMLERLGVVGADVQTFEEWIWTQARQVFSDVPKRASDDTPAAVIRFKRHPALRAVLAELCAPAGRSETEGDEGEDGGAVCAAREDLLHLWGDQRLLARIVESSNGRLTRLMIDEVIAHTRVQFSETTEEASSHVDADRLATLDGRAIDYGTPMQSAGTMDMEDCAVLFELHRSRLGTDRTPKGRLATYQHVVIDEAQEFSPLELAVLGRARSDEGALTIAGDERQQIDPAAYFESWRATVKELGVESYETVTLEESRRCPPEISAFGRRLLSAGVSGGPHASPEEHGKRGRIILSRFPSECHLAVYLTDELSRMLAIDPRTTVAIICREAREAARMERNLRRGLATTLSLNGEFDFLPGISVTSVAEVKGLEFDYVVVPDASASRYPDTPESRRALYVAVTRAIHQVWLTSVGTWSPILPY